MFTIIITFTMVLHSKATLAARLAALQLGEVNKVSFINLLLLIYHVFTNSFIYLLHWLSFYLFVYVFIYWLFIYLFLFFYLFNYLVFIYLSIFIYLFVCLLAFLFIYLFIYLCIVIVVKLYTKSHVHPKSYRPQTLHVIPQITVARTFVSHISR
jgi:hypothetical protein